MMIMIQSKPVFECEEMKQKLARLERENDELKRENDELKRANRTNSHITNLHNPCLPPFKWIDFIYEELQKIYSSLTQKLTDIQKGSNNKDKRNM